MEHFERFHLVRAESDPDVAVHEAVVQEVLANHVTLVAQAQNKVGEAVMRVSLHDVPKDRFAADFDHWLWTYFRLVAQSRPEATAQDHYLHGHARNTRGVAGATPAGRCELAPN